jgi:PAS domain-containing protein
MVISYVLGLSIILQFLAAALALRLIWITGRQLAWLLISSAILLMALRRSISFYILASQGFQSVGELSSELVALLATLFMVVGIGLIGGIFRDNKAREKSSQAADKIFRQFVETANEGVWSIDAQFKTTFINNRTQESG